MTQPTNEPTPKLTRKALVYPVGLLAMLALSYVGAYSMYIGYFTSH